MTVQSQPAAVHSAASTGDRRRRALIGAAAVCVLVLLIDQVTKHTLGTWIKPGQVRHVIPGLELVYVRNTGVAFSFLSSAGALVYVVIAVAIVGLLVHLWLRPARRLVWLPTGMLLGGAIGNLIDRVFHGSVIDFIKLPHWPAFNFADMMITFGVIILALVIEFDSRKRSQP